MKDLTFLIITFLRDEYLFECVKSIRETYGYEPKIIVGENGTKTKEKRSFLKQYKASYFQLPFDSGVAQGRNLIMKKVKTDFVCVGDDDFYYDQDAKADVLFNFIKKNKDVDLVGGRIREKGVVRNYQGTIEIGERFLKYDKPEREDIPSKVDIVFNYFVARTKVCKKIKWDDNIKVSYEHSDYFLSLKKAEKNVWFHPDPIVIHKKEDIVVNSQDYQPFRKRTCDKEYFVNKYNLDYVIGFDGKRADLREVEKPLTKKEMKIKDLKEKEVCEKINQVEFVITMFLRYEALNELLKSITTYYPNVFVRIADYSGKFFDKKFYKEWEGKLNFEVHELRFDCGVSRARNALVELVKTPYFVLLEEDFIFTEQTKIGNFFQLMAEDVGVVGGLCLADGYEQHYEGEIRIRNNACIFEKDKMPLKKINGLQAKETKCVLNFALFNKEIFKSIRWNSELKICEHSAFYLDWQRKIPQYKILYTPEVKIVHTRYRQPNYVAFRGRREKYMQKFFEIYGIERFVSAEGKETRLKNGRLIRK